MYYSTKYLSISVYLYLQDFENLLQRFKHWLQKNVTQDSLFVSTSWSIALLRGILVVFQFFHSSTAHSSVQGVICHIKLKDTVCAFKEP